MYSTPYSPAKRRSPAAEKLAADKLANKGKPRQFSLFVGRHKNPLRATQTLSWGFFLDLYYAAAWNPVQPLIGVTIK